MYGGVDQNRLRTRARKGIGVSVRPFEQNGLADCSRLYGALYVEVLRIITPHEPDLDHFSIQLDLDVDDPTRILDGRGQRFLAEDRLLVLQALHDQPGVGIVRRRDNDGVYAVLLDQRLLILEDHDIRTTLSGQLLGPRAVQVHYTPHLGARDRGTQGLGVAGAHAARPDHANRDCLRIDVHLRSPPPFVRRPEPPIPRPALRLRPLTRGRPARLLSPLPAQACPPCERPRRRPRP